MQHKGEIEKERESERQNDRQNRTKVIIIEMTIENEPAIQIN